MENLEGLYHLWSDNNLEGIIFLILLLFKYDLNIDYTWYDEYLNYQVNTRVH